MKTPIMDINIKNLGKIEDSEEDVFEVWFVAMSGYEGPTIKLPRSLLTKLRDKIHVVIGGDQ